MARTGDGRVWPTGHFTTGALWMNDPNGLVHHDGVWHLFLQHNPHGSDWGTIGWGHATSSDLVTWRWHGTALPATADEQVFSGCVVADPDDTAGLGDGTRTPLVAVYTSHHEPGSPRAGTETQSLAVSRDGGATFERFAGNPVLDEGRSDFRDPKVLRLAADDGPARWLMAVAEPHERRVAFYTSPDLRAWTLASRFGPHGAGTGAWECPDLLHVPVRGSDERVWVLLVNVDRDGPTGGSATQYMPGELVGNAFVAQDGLTRWLDHGHDHYAAVSFADAPDDAVVTIAWASSWLYARDLVDLPWAATMTLARVLELAPEPDGSLSLRSAPVLGPGLTVHRFTLAAGAAAHLRAAGDPAVALRIAYDDGRLVVDRAACAPRGVGPHLVVHAPTRALPEVDVLAVVDAGLVELFVDDGRVTVTEQVTRAAPLTVLDAP